MEREEANNNNNNDVAANEAASTDAAENNAASTQENSVSLEDFNALKQNYTTLENNYNNLQPQLEKFSQLQNFFVGDTAEKTPTFEEVNMSNVSEAAAFTLDQTSQLSQKLEEQAKQIAELTNKNAQADYEHAQLELNEKWLDRFGDDDSYKNALTKLAQIRPEINSTFEEAQQTGKTLTTDFIKYVDMALDSLMAQEMLNPDSEIAKAVYQQMEQKRRLKDGSMPSGNTNVNANPSHGNSGIIQVTYDE